LRAPLARAAICVAPNVIIVGSGRSVIGLGLVTGTE
jgi:hypothetical protein